MFVEMNTYNEISEFLATIRVATKLKGSMGFNDDKIQCEDFFKGLFNELYDLNLINVNSIKVGYPAIDLGDMTTGTCYQITFENTASKIKDTKKKYVSHKIYNDYPILKIFIFDKKPDGRKSDNNTLYLDDILSDIQHKVDELKRRKILAFLRKNYTLIQEAKKSIEIQTISHVVKYLSSYEKNQNDLDDLSEKPFPRAKLKLRFGEFQHCIEEEYAELHGEHNEALVSAKADYIDEGNSKKIKNHLRRVSRVKLYEDKNDAKTALDSLINEIKVGLGFEVYEGALRFYILSELMECDIFPLSQKELTELDVQDVNPS